MTCNYRRINFNFNRKDQKIINLKDQKITKGNISKAQGWVVCIRPSIWNDN